MRVITTTMCGFAAMLTSVAFGQASADADFQKRVLEATAAYKQGNTADAVTKLEVLNKERAGNADVEAWLGFLYLRSNKGNEAIPLLEDASKKRPNDLEVLNNLGNAYFATAQYSKALESYQVVAKLNSKMFEPHYNSGNIFLKQKQYSKAVAEYQLATTLRPEDAFVQNNLGVAYENAKDIKNAAAAFRKASDLKPDNQTFARNAGLTLAKIGKLSEAIPYLEKSDPSDTSVALALGEAYSKQGNKVLALKAYEAAKSSQGKNATFWFNLSVLRAQNGDAAGAEEGYKKTLEISPNDLDTLNNLGLLQFKKGAYTEAESTFDKLSGLNPSSVSAKLNLAASASKAGDSKRAITCWKEVIRLSPDRTQVRLDLANGLYDEGDYDGAKYHYQQVLLVEKDSSEALNGIGLIYLRDSKLAQAEAAFRGSIAGDSKYLPAYNNLAITLERMNRKEQAIAILEKAAKIDPADEDVRRNLRRLRTEG